MVVAALSHTDGPKGSEENKPEAANVAIAAGQAERPLALPPPANAGSLASSSPAASASSSPRRRRSRRGRRSPWRWRVSLAYSEGE